MTDYEALTELRKYLAFIDKEYPDAIAYRKALKTAISALEERIERNEKNGKSNKLH